jgi:DNA-binding NtrC family response regulator
VVYFLSDSLVGWQALFCCVGKEAMKQKLCLVEDDVIIRLDTAQIFENAGFDVKEFGDADHALRYLEIAAPETSVIVTDIRLPGEQDGLALARIAEKRWPWIRIVVVSSFLGGFRELPPGASAAISKPFRDEELVAKATGGT